HLVFEVEGEKAVEITTERIAQSLRDINSKKKLNAEITSKGLLITVAPSSMEIRKAIEDNYPVLAPVETGTNIVYTISDKEAKRIKDNAADQALEKIRNRIDGEGVKEPTIHRQGTNEIVVQLPGIKDPKKVIEMIGQTGQLEFKLVDDSSPVAAEIPASIEPGEEDAVLEKFAEKIPADDEILFEKKVNRETGVVVRKIPILVKKQAALKGDLLKEAKVTLDSGQPHVSMVFNPAGAKLFDEVTAANVKKRLAIVLDNTIYSAPEIKERIGGGNAQISGSFSMEEAKRLATVLREGALPAPLKMLQNITVGPSLGTDSIEAGKMAGIIGTILVVVFMIIYYKLSGIIADIALVFNIVLLLGAMAFFNVT
ncbi:MAG: protein translocase subunit SecD, partial [Nitrospirota bacterium]|nr:protein translocase subunit SecD [Nitrospirota bacterium]